MTDSVFIQLAAYRDPETLNTIHDALEKASRPSQIHIGLCWQYLPGIDEHMIFATEPDSRVRLISVPAHQSKGVCWARHVAQSLYRGEDYVLSVDSHTRFVDGWDEQLINELSQCDSSRPVISCYPPQYSDNGSYDVNAPCSKMVLSNINSGNPRFKSLTIAERYKAPAATLFPACGFYFAPGSIMKDIPVDPVFYFDQEEFVFALKLWTHGYDCFSPTKNMVFHQYLNIDDPFRRTLHWEDVDSWQQLDRKAQIRLACLLDGEFDPAQDEYPVSQFPLGSVRSVTSFYEAAGIVRYKGKFALQG